MARKGLGKGLDALIPQYYDEDFDSNSTQSLEDMLAEDEEKTVEEVIEDVEEDIEEEPQAEEEASEEEIEEEAEDEDEKEDIDPQVLANVNEVKEIVEKNPRITLWSSRSSAVFRYLRKTEPEFSISKEASILIDEAVSKKYPEIWKLFED